MANQQATIDAIFVETYEQTVQHLAQQRFSRMLPVIRQRFAQSEGHNWERLGDADATLKAPTPGTPTATPVDDFPFSRRRSVSKTYHTGDLVGKEDIAQTLIDPNSNLAKAQGMSMGRSFDDEILRALNAANASDDGNGGTETFATGGGTTVGDGTGGISYDIVTEIAEAFMANDVDPDERKFIVCSPKQARRILQLTEATSGDYNAMRPLTSEHYVESWMGFTWIVSTRLISDDAGTTRFGQAFTEDAVGIHIAQNVQAEVAQDPSASFDWRVYCSATFGATRIDDRKVVQLDLLE